MKQITFNVNDVLPALQMANSVVSAKSTMPILADMVIKSFRNAEGGLSAVFHASDSEQWLSVRSELVSGDVDFAIAVAAADFVKVLKGLDGRVVTLTFDDGSSVVNGRYDNGEFNMPVDNVDDFPNQPYGNEQSEIMTIGASTLLQAIGFTEIAVSNDILRPVMNGVHFDFFGDRMVSVALDKMKFAKYTNRTVASGEDRTIGFTLPIGTARITAQLLQKIDGDVKITLNSNSVAFSRSEFKLVSRLNEGTYPPYDKLLSGETPLTATASRSDIIEAVKRILPLGSTDSSLVKFHFTDGELTMSTENIAFSKSANERVKCDYEGEPFSIGLNGNAVITLLTNISDDNVTIRMSAPHKFAIIVPETQQEDEEYTTLLMPLLLNPIPPTNS